MYLRLCLESILRDFFNEPKSSLANLIKKVQKTKKYAYLPWTKYINSAKDFLNNASHTTSSIDFEKEPLQDDINLVLSLIDRCVSDLYDSEKELKEFAEKQEKRNQKIVK